MHARLDHCTVTLLTRTGLDWTRKYPAIAKAVAELNARQAYLDGELCGVVPRWASPRSISFSWCRTAAMRRALVFFLFDLVDLDGEDLRPRPLIEHKERLRRLLANAEPCLHYSDHVVGQGSAFYEKASAIHVEGIVSKTQRCALFALQSRPVSQDQMPQPSRICCGRLDGSRREPAASRCLAARLL